MNGIPLVRCLSPAFWRWHDTLAHAHALAITSTSDPEPWTWTYRATAAPEWLPEPFRALEEVVLERHPGGHQKRGILFPSKATFRFSERTSILEWGDDALLRSARFMPLSGEEGVCVGQVREGDNTSWMLFWGADSEQTAAVTEAIRLAKALGKEVLS